MKFKQNQSKKVILLMCSIFIFSFYTAQSQNPFVTEIYTADPTARVFNNKLYVYPSHDVDICTPQQGNNGFCMPNYHMFSTNDLVNWKDHGVILSQNSIPWVKKNSFGMWAPDCIKRNETYYYFFPAPPKDNSAFRKIGVATSNSPTGPFIPEPNYIQGVSGIDPGLLVDSDNTGYMYFAQGGNLKVVKLKNNMKQIDSGITTINNMPAGYKEGPFAFKKDNTYYLTFAHVGPNNYEIGYATSNNPLGPFTYKGTLMENIGNGTNHASVANYKGKWYLFYHYWSLSGNKKLRSIRADEIIFNPNGTIRSKVATLRGIGVPKAGDKIQIDRYNAINKARVNLVQGNEPKGFQVDYIQNNGWIKFNKVNFENVKLNQISARVASPKAGGKIEFRIGSSTGKLIATLNVPNTGAWSNWRTVTTNITASTSGVQNLVCVFKGTSQYLFNLNWVRFTNQNTSAKQLDNTTTTNNDIKVSYIDTSKIIAHPNPMNQNVSISGLKKGDQIKIYNSLGKKAYEIQTKGDLEIIPTTNLSPGLYIVFVNGNSEIKLIKQ